MCIPYKKNHFKQISIKRIGRRSTHLEIRNIISDFEHVIYIYMHHGIIDINTFLMFVRLRFFSEV